jgi:hypothetical protein
MQIDSVLIGIVQPSSNIMTAEPLKQQRDELRVRLYLAKAEVKDEWARLEKQWEELMEARDSAWQRRECWN